MAAPPEVTTKNLSGKYVMNKTLSDDVDAMLALQGLSWFTRKAISLATVVLTIKEYEQDSVYHIDITSVASGLSTTQEDRTLDWEERDHADRIFGNVKGRSRWWKEGEKFEKLTPGGEEVAAFLRAEKLKDGKTDSKFLDDEHVQSWAKNVDSGGGWTAEQYWGFEEIEGKRYYTRRVVVEKGGKIQMARLVYNYTGKVDKKDEDDQDLAYGE